MKTYTAAELAEVIESHGKWLRDEEGGSRAVLRGADLSGADLSGANLSDADLRRANLSDADLSGADLSDADLRRANLSDADLSGANLSDADLWSVRGNREHIKSIQCDRWDVTYSATHLQIGCQRHEISEWWAFDDSTISKMDGKAVAWWQVWKPILKQIIETSPATPTGAENKSESEEAA